jgi:hypothetical protein
MPGSRPSPRKDFRNDDAAELELAHAGRSAPHQGRERDILIQIWTAATAFHGTHYGYENADKYADEYGDVRPPQSGERMGLKEKQKAFGGMGRQPHARRSDDQS